MRSSHRFAILVAMVLFSIVSIWTTYVSLKDSILPKPTIPVTFGPGQIHQLSIFALALSLAIGLMLFALKLSIIDGHKRLNVLGILGLTVVASISIAFNMDVLYRTADQQFFLNYSEQRVRTAYEDYLATAQTKLNARKQELDKQVAKQEGELESEIKGLREKPAGYGNVARKEEYELTLLEKQAQVEQQEIVAALEKKKEVDDVLSRASVTKLDDVTKLQDDLRLKIKDFAALANTPMPPAVKLESPIFAVFQKLFNFRTAGPIEYLILALAFLLDLADIVGYTLVPAKVEKKQPAIWAAVPEDLPGPGAITSPEPAAMVLESAAVGGEPILTSADDDVFPSIATSPRPRRKPFRFRR